MSRTEYEVVLNGAEGALVEWTRQQIRAGTFGCHADDWAMRWNVGASANELLAGDLPAFAIYEREGSGAEERRLLVAILPNGEVRLGKGINLRRASIAFYRVVGTMLRLTQGMTPR